MKEIEIMIGWECNNNCLFCSNQYLKQRAKKLEIGNIDSERIKSMLPSNKDKKIDTLVFVGGEPTITKDFFKIIKLAKNKGYRRISIMSNGRMLSNINFCRRLLNEGITDIGISVHGQNAGVQDSITRSHGSFKQTVWGMKNLAILDKRFMTNTVINKKNYKFLPEIVKFLSQFNPYLILLTFPNPRGNAEKYFKNIMPKYSEVLPCVIEAIQIGRNLNQNIRTSDIPFCFMEGYTDYMQELFFRKERRIISHVFRNIVYKTLSGRDKRKTRYCRTCRYSKICEGVWSNYLKIIGDSEFKR